MKGDNGTVKTRKTKTITALCGVVLLLCVAVLGVWFGLKKENVSSNDPLNELPVASVSDEATLRELLLEESERTIEVTGDIEVEKEFIVKGTKTLTGDAELRMALSAEWGQSLLVVSENATLTMDGLVLNGNYVADGIHMDTNGTLTYLSGKIRCTDVYSIQAQGIVTIKDVNIEKAEYIGVFAEKGSVVNVEGGLLKDTATNDIYVQNGALVEITGDANFDGCMGDSVMNYGSIKVCDGTFSNSNSYTFNNYGELTIAGENKEGGFVECTGSRLGVVCTRKDAKTSISGLHVYDTNRQAVVTVGGETTISESKFERTGYHAIEIQKGDATVERVTVVDSKNAGMEAYTGAKVDVKDFTVNGCKGIGIASRGGTITGNDIQIANAGKYGISCGNSKNGKGLVTVSNVVVTDPEKSGFYVYNKANMELDTVEVSGSKSRGIYIEDTASLTLSGKSKIHENEYRGIEARGKFVMNDGEVFNNKVKNSGAGVYISEKGNFTMNGGAIYNNASGVRGGGICVTEGKVTINNGEVYNNTAVNNGGGLYAQKKAVVTLKSGSIKNNKSEAYGDGIYVVSVGTKVKMSDGFYLGGNDVKLDNTECVLEITGSNLSKHSASDPLLLTPNYNAKEGTAVAVCKNSNIAKSLAVKVKSGDGSYNVIQDAKNFTIAYASADMDMTGADTVYVSNFKELQNAVKDTESKRFIVLKNDIVMEERLRLPGGVTICIKDDGTKRTITRGADFADNMFVTHYGTGLYLEATKAGNLVLDGKTSGTVTEGKVQPLVRVAGSTVLRNVTLQNNGSLTKGSTVRGALMRQLYGDFEIYNSEFIGGLCESGGAVMLDKGKGYIEASTFVNNQSMIGGGALRAAANTTLEVVNSLFDNNHAGTAGGAIVAVTGSDITLKDTRFTNNTAANFGGAVSVQGEGTKLTLIGTDSKLAYMSNNSSKTIGAVCVMEKAVANVEGYTFDSNEATGGRAGAIAVNSGATAKLKNAEFYKNQSSGSGAAIATDSGQLEVINCKFGKQDAGNIAGDKAGVILVTGSASLVSSKNAFDSNASGGPGGAIYVNTGSKADVKNDTYKNNTAAAGGAIYVATGAAVNSEAVDFTNNAAAKETETGILYGNGGAVQCYGTYNDKNSTYTENTGKNGGAIIVMTGGKATLSGSNENALLRGNKTIPNVVVNAETNATSNDGGNGGAIFVNSGGVAEVTAYTFDKNNGNNGGAIYIAGALGDTEAGKMTTAKSVFTGNLTHDGTDGDGGAVNCAGSYVDAGSSFIGNNSEFGGAIYAKGIVSTKESKFSENTAYVEGGAIYTYSGGETVVEKCIFDANGAKIGGALYVHAYDGVSAKVTTVDSTFTKNKALKDGAYGNGGAVCCYGTYVDKNSSFSENEGKNGAAVFVMEKAQATLTGTDATFKNNKAIANVKEDSSLDGGNGGAIFVNTNSTVVLSGYAFAGNVNNGGKTDDVYARGTVEFGDASGKVTFIQSSRAAKFVPTADITADRISIEPYVARWGEVVLTKSEDMSADLFATVASKVGISSEDDVAWKVDASGKLVFDNPTAKVTVNGNDIYYKTLAKAVEYANKVGGTESTDNLVITVLDNQEISSTIKTKVNLTIVNETGKNITLSRGANFKGDMLYVEAGKLVLGTNDEAETGTLIVDGHSIEVVSGRIVDNRAGSIFVLGKNATLNGANSNNWGAALTNRGTADLYGNVSNNICTGAGGAILQTAGSGKLTIHSGNYTGNQATRVKAGSTTAGNGACINVQASTETAKAGEIEIKGGTFSGNKTKGNGGVMNVYTDTVVTITGGNFLKNEAEADGGAIAIATSTATLEANKVYMNIKDNTEDTVNDVVFKENKANRGGAIFIIQKGTVATEKVLFEANESKGNGGAIITYGTYTDNNSKFDGNKSTGGNGGAIIVMSDGKATMTGDNTNAQFVDNSLDNASKNGAAIFIQGSVTLKGYTFEDTTQSIYVTGTLLFDDLTDAIIKQGSASAKLKVAGSNIAVGVEITPHVDNYVTKKQIVSAAEGVDATVLKAACEKIKITDEADGTKWKLTDDGKLAHANPVAKMTINGVEDTYKSLKAAVDVANANGSLDTATTIYLLRNTTVDGQIKIEKNITIQNEPGVNVTITRGKIASDITMFYIGNKDNNLAAKLTLGTNEANETGTITLDGENKSITSRFIENRGTATFILGKNATFTKTKSNQWGAAVVNRGSMMMYGNINNIECTGAGGAILVTGAGASLTIESGNYSNNKATRTTDLSLGGFLRVESGTVIINGGKFSNNSTTGSGNTIYSKGSLTINNGAVFAETDDAIHVADGTLTINSATITPTTYTEGTAMITKASGVDAEAFATACGNITVSPENGKSEWYINGNGQLTRYEASITSGENILYYKNLSDAMAYANTNGGTGESVAIEINLYKNLEVNEKITVSKNITIKNGSGKELVIKRGGGITSGDMIEITAGKLSVIGSESAKIVLDGGVDITNPSAATKGRAIKVGTGATLDMQHIKVQKFYYNGEGGALYVQGSVSLNSCQLAANKGNGAGGAIRIASGGRVITTNTVFDGNMTANTQNGGAISCAGTFEDTNGRFVNNVSAKHGGALIVMSGGIVTLTKDENATEGMATFNGNAAASTYKGGAIFINSGGTVTINGKYIFSDNSPVDIHIGGTLNNNGGSTITKTP